MQFMIALANTLAVRTAGFFRILRCWFSRKNFEDDDVGTIEETCTKIHGIASH